MKTINILGNIGAILVLIVILSATGFIGASYGIAAALVYVIGMALFYAPLMAFNLKITHFFLMRKRDEEIKRLVERIEKLEGVK